jgi:hypothetical protein
LLAYLGFFNINKTAKNKDQAGPLLQVTQYEYKPNKNTTQDVLDTTIRKQTQIT